MDFNKIFSLDWGFSMLRWILAAVCGYLFGSISSAVLLSRGLFREDVRSMGSGNAGATNMARVYGMLPGILAFFCDALKTVAAMGLGWLLDGSLGMSIGGVACLIGHCWPVFFQMRGGKGVSVGAVVALMIDWRILLLLVVIFFVVFAITKVVSICSIAVAVVLPVAALLLPQPLPEQLLAIFAGLLVIWQHRTNILRLIRGEEKKFVPKSRKKE